MQTKEFITCHSGECNPLHQRFEKGPVWRDCFFDSFSCNNFSNSPAKFGAPRKKQTVVFCVSNPTFLPLWTRPAGTLRFRRGLGGAGEKDRKASPRPSRLHAASYPNLAAVLFQETPGNPKSKARTFSFLVVPRENSVLIGSVDLAASGL